MIDHQLQEAHETLEALPLDGHEITDEEFRKLFTQTPEDQGLTEDDKLPI
jgi:hypothetical protein